MHIHIIINTCILWLQCENMPRRRRNCITEMVEKFLVTDNESKSFEANTFTDLLLNVCFVFSSFDIFLHAYSSPEKKIQLQALIDQILAVKFVCSIPICTFKRPKNCFVKYFVFREKLNPNFIYTIMNLQLIVLRVPFQLTI